MHKHCLPANPHETFLDQLISAEPDGEFQEKRKRFLSVTVASGYLYPPSGAPSGFRFIGCCGFSWLARLSRAALCAALLGLWLFDR
jgi:hypothetical protein